MTSTWSGPGCGIVMFEYVKTSGPPKPSSVMALHSVGRWSLRTRCGRHDRIEWQKIEVDDKEKRDDCKKRRDMFILKRERLFNCFN